MEAASSVASRSQQPHACFTPPIPPGSQANAESGFCLGPVVGMEQSTRWVSFLEIGWIQFELNGCSSADSGWDLKGCSRLF